MQELTPEEEAWADEMAEEVSIDGLKESKHAKALHEAGHVVAGLLAGRIFLCASIAAPYGYGGAVAHLEDGFIAERLCSNAVIQLKSKDLDVILYDFSMFRA